MFFLTILETQIIAFEIQNPTRSFCLGNGGVRNCEIKPAKFNFTKRQIRTYLPRTAEEGVS